VKNILLGITGGISAYKSANIVSQLKKKGYSVKVIMTKNATKIITPLTFETLSRNKVYVDMWDESKGYEVEHISLAEWADLVLVAPTTYNVIGKIANGIADDMLTTVISATKVPVFFALAMNENMYNNPILSDNVDKLKGYGYRFIEADEGFLACNTNGKGRLKKEEEIIEIIEEYFIKKDYPQVLQGKTVVITAGPTEEPLDPVRFITNLSSGKMGYSLAEACAKLGAQVTLISGPTKLEPPMGLKKFISVRTALQMEKETLKYYENIDIAIACAAVGDYRPKIYYKEKIKKSDSDFSVELIRNPDILYQMGLLKKNQFLMGFAAETENILENATLKLNKKNLDVIVANDASNMGNGNNTVTLVEKNGKITPLKREKKSELAYTILLKLFSKVTMVSLMGILILTGCSSIISNSTGKEKYSDLEKKYSVILKKPRLKSKEIDSLKNKYIKLNSRLERNEENKKLKKEILKKVVILEDLSS
jgi:phosphopantothenoylcysteine decarboxylase/phosphopantothenate--cysteine ligase